MKYVLSLMIGGLGLLMAATMSVADSHDVNPAIKARQSHMQLYGFNLGTLGAMAKGDIDYDAEAASAAAANLVALTQLSQAAYWPQGTDSDASGGTRALPALWQNFPDVIAKATAVSEAAVAMEAAAGTGLDELRAAIGPLGGACTACHKAFRKPQ